MLFREENHGHILRFLFLSRKKCRCAECALCKQNTVRQRRSGICGTVLDWNVGADTVLDTKGNDENCGKMQALSQVHSPKGGADE